MRCNVAEDAKQPVQSKNNKNQSKKTATPGDQQQTRDDKNRDPNPHPASKNDVARDSE